MSPQTAGGGGEFGGGSESVCRAACCGSARLAVSGVRSTCLTEMEGSVPELHEAASAARHARPWWDRGMKNPPFFASDDGRGGGLHDACRSPSVSRADSGSRARACESGGRARVADE